MPISNLGDTKLNDTSGEDEDGSRVYLVQDSNLGAYGFFGQYPGSTQAFYTFFVDRNGGISDSYYLGEDRTFYVAEYDQDVILVYPEDGDYDSYPPTRYNFEGPAGTVDPEALADYPPLYIFDGRGLRLIDGEEIIPAGRESMIELSGGVGGRAEVYEAEDGDGTGVFLRVTDSQGRARGGITRVNDEVSGDQGDPSIVALDDGQFTIGWTQTFYDGGNEVEFRANTYSVGSNLGFAIAGEAGDQTLAGDEGDFITDMFFYDTRAGEGLGRDRIESFGANDVLITTTKIRDSNNDGIITFGRDKRLNLADESGDRVASLNIEGVRSLEFDGALEANGVTYYVYSRLGSDADEFTLIL